MNLTLDNSNRKPDLTFSYHASTRQTTIFGKSGNYIFGSHTYTIQKNLNDDVKIGEVLKLWTDKISKGEYLNHAEYICYLPEGTISFVDNRSLKEEKPFWEANATFIFPITNPTGDFTFSKGYIIVKRDNAGGRECFVYFDK